MLQAAETENEYQIIPDQQTVQQDETPVNAEIAFSNHKGQYKKRIEKRQRKLLGKAEFIRPFLHQGEQVLLVTQGCSPVGFLEQVITGWIVFYLKRSLFIFTNRRIFHVPAKQDFSYRGSVAQILYGDCSDIRIKGRTLDVKYNNGQREKFLYIGSRERKKIKSILSNDILESLQSQAQGRTHLCPGCSGELVVEQYTCPQCGKEFKSRDEARKISILYPGGGYFYTRHPWLGIGDAIGETFLAAMVVSGVIQGLAGDKEGWILAAWFGFFLFIEKLITIYHSNHFVKEYIPK